MTEKEHPAPGDMLEYRCPSFGIVWQWRVHSVHLGAMHTESLIEVSPVHLQPGFGHGHEAMPTVWVPEPMTRNLTLCKVKRHD